MDAEYGRAGYRAVLEGGEERLKKAITCGGLAATKSKAILGVLKRVDEREKGKGGLSLEYLREMVSGGLFCWSSAMRMGQLTF